MIIHTLPSRHALIAILLSLVTLPAAAQWQPTSGPIGGDVRPMVATDDEILVGTLTGGVFRSTDDGRTWAPSSTGLRGVCIRSLCGSATSVFAATCEGFYRSIDGTEWRHVRGLDSLVDYDHAAAFDRVVLAWAGGRCFRSVDDGMSWSDLNDPFNGAAIEAIAARGSIVLAGTSKGLYRSVDRGLSWSRPTGDPTTLPITSLVDASGSFFAGTGGGVYSSSDGASWTRASDGLEVPGVSALTVHLGTVKAAGFDARIYRYDWSSQSWSPGERIVQGQGISALLSHESTLLAAIGQIGIYRNTGGDSWVESNTGLVARTVTSLLADGGTLYAGGWPAGIWSTRDRGARWRADWDGSVSDIARALMRTDSTVFAMMPGLLYRRHRAETGWTRVVGPAGSEPTAIAALGSRAFVGTSKGIYRTTDEGRSWSTMSTIGIDGPVTSLLVTDAMVFAGTTKGIVRSTDDGGTWSSSDAGLQGSLVVTMHDASSLLFASTGGGLHRSTDGGLSWTPVASVMMVGSVTDIADAEGAVFTGGSGGVHRSTDDGLTWTNVTGAIEAREVIALAASGDDLYVGINGGGVWRASVASFGTGSVSTESNSSRTLHVWPVPATRAATIMLSSPLRNAAGPTSITICAPDGSTIDATALASIDREHVEVRLAGFSTGVYHLTIERGAERGRAVIVVMR